MAYTKIFAVRDSLSRIVSYAANPDKTTLGEIEPLSDMLGYALDADKMLTAEIRGVERSETGETGFATGHAQHLFESAINCAAPGTAYAEMRATKERYGKKGGVLGYHVIQSFAPGEVTPQQAHNIGVEFALQCFGDRFEVVVGTHLDKGHLHNHIVLNSVSCTDGQKYRSNKGSYYKVIRGTSDALCRQHGLSIIEPEGRGKHYKQWADEKSGKPSGATLIKADIDDAIQASFTFTAFIEQMKKRGYGVKCGPNIAHMAVKPKGGKQFFRLDTFRDPWYTEAAIKERIAAAREGRPPNIPDKPAPNTPKPPPAYTPAHYKLPPSRPWRKPRKLKGFVALYWKYCYLLRETMHRKLPNRAAFLLVGSTSLRDEVRKFERYQRQFLLLYKNRLETVEDLQGYRQEKQNALDAGVAERKDLYIERRKSGEERQAEISAEIAKINESLRAIRREIRQCGQIMQDAQRLQSTCEAVDAAAEKHQDIALKEQHNKKQGKE